MFAEESNLKTMQSQGVIKIHSKSPYEHLDPITLEWFHHVKQMWPHCKRSGTLYDMLFQFFSNSKDPFKSALQLMVSSDDFHSGKENTLAFYIMEIFSDWLKRQDMPKIPKAIKVDAANLVTRQKNLALIKLVVDIYRMVEDKELLIERITQLCKIKYYKEACQLANILNLHDFFGIEEFLIPLVFQDRYVIAEQFLRKSEKHQIDLALFLDGLIGKNNVKKEVQSVIMYLDIFDAKGSSLSYKPLCKLLVRIIKAFNLPPTTCPNLARKRGKGTLQFLLNKRYKERTIGGESWTEMVLEAIGDSKTLQAELIRSVTYYGDLKEAFAWVERFGTPEEAWPAQLKEFTQRGKNGSGHSVDDVQEENWNSTKEEASAMKFHKLSIEESQVKVIDTASGFSEFIDDLAEGISIIGIDAEWKPSFGFQKCDLALIQIAAFHVVYIVDVITLASAAPQALWERFAKVFFESSNILKLGFGINSDMVIVKEMFWKVHGIKTGSDVGFVDLSILWRTLVQKYKFVFPFQPTSKSSENLNSLIEMCLGETLNKSDQFSNWENRPLRKGQIIYAAIDAYCLLEAYNVIVKECESQNIPISDVIDEILLKAAKKNTAGKKKKGGKSHKTIKTST